LPTRGARVLAAHGRGSPPLCVVKLRQVVAGSPRGVGAARVGDRAPMLSPAPIAPEERRGTHLERMQQHADLAWFCRRTAIPLTRLSQRTSTTTAKAGAIDHAQAAIGFCALLMREQLLGSLATQCPIGLESKVLSREATSFPGEAHVRGSIARWRSRVQRKRWSGWGRWDGRSKLGRAHGIRMQLMPQLQEPRSRPIAIRVASIPVPRPSESTSDRGPVRRLHLKAEARNAPRCRYSSTTSEAVNRGSWQRGEEQLVDNARMRETNRALLCAGPIGWPPPRDTARPQTPLALQGSR
jgi:hypothetical protein